MVAASAAARPPPRRGRLPRWRRRPASVPAGGRWWLPPRPRAASTLGGCGRPSTCYGCARADAGERAGGQGRRRGAGGWVGRRALAPPSIRRAPPPPAPAPPALRHRSRGGDRGWQARRCPRGGRPPRRWGGRGWGGSRASRRHEALTGGGGVGVRAPPRTDAAAGRLLGSEAGPAVRTGRERHVHPARVAAAVRADAAAATPRWPRRPHGPPRGRARGARIPAAGAAARRPLCTGGNKNKNGLSYKGGRWRAAAAACPSHPPTLHLSPFSRALTPPLLLIAAHVVTASSAHVTPRHPILFLTLPTLPAPPPRPTPRWLAHLKR